MKKKESPKKVVVKVKIKVKKRPMKRRTPKGKAKIEKVMHEFGEGELRSGSKKGPIVKNKRQALAIAFSEQLKSGK